MASKFAGSHAYSFYMWGTYEDEVHSDNTCIQDDLAKTLICLSFQQQYSEVQRTCVLDVVCVSKLKELFSGPSSKIL